MSQYRRVMRFMNKHGQEMPREPFAPKVPSDEVVRQRCEWLLEETLEFLKACLDFSHNAQHYADTIECLRAAMRLAPVKVDLVAYADANADIRYIAYGSDVAAGIDGDATDLAVAESNDTKQGVDANGKITKGPNYVPPAIAETLRADGWKP